jgi:hypothetical protein
MLKSAVIICGLFFVGLSVQAQYTPAKPKPHPVADSVANEMCSCIMSNKDSITTLNAFYTAINDCLKKNSLPVMDELLKEDGFIQKDDRKARADAIRMIGVKLGRKVAEECSGFKAMKDSITEKENNKAFH